jgi:hypothetical protein
MRWNTPMNTSKNRVLWILSLILLVSLAGCTTPEETSEIAKEPATVAEPEPTKPVEEPTETTEERVNETVNLTESDDEPTEPLPVVEEPDPIPEPVWVNGKNTQQRIDESIDRLHTSGSGKSIMQNFPDVELVYTDYAKGTGFPNMILPFKYYYSEEANKTFNVCAIDRTVFICDGKMDRLIDSEDVDSDRCEITSVYMGDPRIGGSGGQAYG